MGDFNSVRSIEKRKQVGDAYLRNGDKRLFNQLILEIELEDVSRIGRGFK